MKVSSFTYLLTLLGLTALASLHSLFRDNYDKVDVFLFSDATIYLENVIRDLTNLFVVFFLLVLLYKHLPKQKRLLTAPFIALSLLDIADYFIVYQQLSYLKLLALIFLLWKAIRKIQR
jgi:uncharacterized BrkB/YihY/UPF0761 family membrane protein